MSKVDVETIIKQKEERQQKEQAHEDAFVNAEEVVCTDWKSTHIDQLAEALSQAQSELEGAKKNAKNEFLSSYGYADLHSVIQSSFPIITKYGLSVTQGNELIQGHVCVTTTLLHKSGQWIRSKIKMPLTGKKDSQAVGSCMTYGRRYGLSAIVGIAQFDADANDLNPNYKKR